MVACRCGKRRYGDRGANHGDVRAIRACPFLRVRRIFILRCPSRGVALRAGLRAE